MTSAVDERLYEVTLTQSEVDLLQRLMKASADDPRLHGTIGTCFWFHGILEEDTSTSKILGLPSKRKWRISDDCDG